MDYLYMHLGLDRKVKERTKRIVSHLNQQFPEHYSQNSRNSSYRHVMKMYILCPGPFLKHSIMTEYYSFTCNACTSCMFYFLYLTKLEYFISWSAFYRCIIIKLFKVIFVVCFIELLNWLIWLVVLWQTSLPKMTLRFYFRNMQLPCHAPGWWPVRMRPLDVQLPVGKSCDVCYSFRIMTVYDVYGSAVAFITFSGSKAFDQMEAK